MITRNEAVNTLYQLINSDILDKGITEELEDIARCIEDEKLGYHAWGAEDDYSKLHIAYREDLWTDELQEKLQGIHDKYSFTPTPYEREELEALWSEDD